MRIVHVTDCYLPRLGGIETQVHDLAVRQRAAGHEVEVVTSVAADPTGSDARDGLVVHRPAPGATLASVRYGASLPGRNRVLRGGYDLVHVHASTFSPLAFATAAATSRAGPPTVVTVHSLWAYATPLFRLADHVVNWGEWSLTWSAVSNAAAAPLRRVLRDRADVALLPNGVDPLAWRTEPRHPPPNDVLIVAVMRLAPRKRPRHLLRMLRQVRDRLPRWLRLRAILIGDGPERGVLEHYLRRHDMAGWVSLPGRFTREQIHDVFRRADVFVAPATLESFGIATLEARAAGLPVVARAATGATDFIADGREGLLVDSDRAMVDAVVHLAASPRARAELAAYNRAVTPSATWDRVLRRCEALYAAAYARPHRRRTTISIIDPVTERSLR